MLNNHIGTLILAKSVQESSVFISGMNAKDWITILIPALVTLIGFIVTYFSLRKSFKDEIRKQKSNIALEKMSTVPFETLELYETFMKPGRLQKKIKQIESRGNMTRSDQTEVQKIKKEIEDTENSFYDKMAKLYNTIYAYGSVKSIQIVSAMQKTNYQLGKDAAQEDKYKIIAYLVLLSSQVKKDVTNISVSPEYWFQMKITDYEPKKDEFDPVVNQIVDELELDFEFKIR